MLSNKTEVQICVIESVQEEEESAHRRTLRSGSCEVQYCVLISEDMLIEFRFLVAKTSKDPPKAAIERSLRNPFWMCGNRNKRVM